MRRSLAFGIVCGWLCFLSACAGRQAPEPIIPASTEAAAVTWSAFERYAHERAVESGPFRIQCALRYSNQGEGRRVTAVLWGNGQPPLRLDVTAFGALVGRIRQDSNALLVHAPRENKAWFHQGQEQAFLAFGLPVPLTLPDIASLLQGRFLDVFGPVHGAQPFLSGEGIRFTLEGGRLPGTVVIAEDGLLQRWQEAPGSWLLEIRYEGVPPLPISLDISHPQGRHAVIAVTDREYPSAPYSDRQLELQLPEGTALAPLRQASR